MIHYSTILENYFCTQDFDSVGGWRCPPYRKLRHSPDGHTLILCAMKGFHLHLAVTSDPSANWLCCGFIVWPFLAWMAQVVLQVTIQPGNEENIQPGKQKL